MGRTSTINLFAIIASARRRVVVPHVSKQHLAVRGNNVKNCSCVPLDVCDYFRRELDRTADQKTTKKKKRLLREEVEYRT
jgi:hypothetical protein